MILHHKSPQVWSSFTSWALAILLTAGSALGQGDTKRQEPRAAYSKEFLQALSKMERPMRQQLPARIPGTRQETLIDTKTKKEYLVVFDTSQQAYSLSLPTDHVPGRPKLDHRYPANEQPSFSAPLGASLITSGNFNSASALAFKAKHFDDGLYAAIEMAVDQGNGQLASRASILARLAVALNEKERETRAHAFLGVAAHLGGTSIPVPLNKWRQVTAVHKEFLITPRHSKPISFYTWTPQLSGIYQRDRLLQTPMDSFGPAAPMALATALSSDLKLRADCHIQNRLYAGLTNGLVANSLVTAADQLADGQIPDLQDLPLFPASRSHESDLMTELFRYRPIPEGFDLADEMVRRIQAGEMDLKPKADSGWYDYQTYALEPLVIPEQMPEAAHLEFNEAYKKELIKLFKALLALTRESHAKQVVLHGFPGAMGMRDVKIRLTLRPELSQEPLASFYLRRAQSYRFVRNLLVETFGKDQMYRLCRLTPEGRINLQLDRELRLMESLFYGAYLNTALEIGMTPTPQEDLGLGHAPSLALYQQWKAKEDPDLARDIRMMVPVFHDLQRQKTKVWVVMGVTSRPLTIRYKTRPTLKTVLDEHHQPIDLERVILNTWEEAKHRVSYPVMEELYVDKILNREEFRALCDKYRTREAIIQALQELK